MPGRLCYGAHVAQPRLLVVDDDPSAIKHAIRMLKQSSITIECVNNGVDAVRRVLSAIELGRPFDVILLDYFMPGADGVHVVRQLAARGLGARVILMSGHDPTGVAIEAMRLGVFDFISKPLDRAELRLRVERAVRHVQSGTTREAGRRARKSDVIIGGGEWIKHLYERISMVAPTDVTVAISGETGTGKELVARTIHNLSHRYERPFVVVNCGAIPDNLLEDELFGHVRGAFTDAAGDRDGLFATAHDGTLFLDEIGEMPLALQVKLLRVLQSQEFRRLGEDHYTHVDVRLITATNRELDKAVQAGVFRQDLFYRINVFPITLPPLRERLDDLPLLCQHFLLKHRTKVGKDILGFTPAALAKLGHHDFPGNVRELENKVHQALVLAQGQHIHPGDITIGASNAIAVPDIDITRTFRELKRKIIEAFESRYLQELLLAHRGNLAAAARQAGMDRKNLWSMAKKYDIDPNAFRASKEDS